MKTVFGFNNDKKTNKSSVISNYVAEKSLVEGLLRIAKNGIPSTIKTSMVVYDEKTQQFYTGAGVSGTPKKISDVIVVDSLASVSEGQEGVLYVGLKECACAVWADNQLQTLYYTKDEIDNKIIKAITDDNTEFDLVTFLKKVDAEATYLKKTDATVQDGSIIKASRTPAVNMEELDKALAAEKADRTNADKAHDQAISDTNKKLETKEATIKQRIDNVVSALNQSDQTLQTHIDELANNEKVSTDGFAVRRSDTVGQNLQNLDDAVKKEIVDRTNADNTLQTSITATAQKAASDLNLAKSTLQSNIDTNTAAIATNKSAIATETSDRTKAIEKESNERGAADQALKENINTVEAGYKAADEDLTKKINGVDNAYKAADLKISNDLSAAQTSLSSQISQVQTNLNTTNGNLSKEVEDRTNAITLTQNNLQTQLNNVKTDLQAADTAEQKARLDADNEIKATAKTLNDDYTAFKTQYNTDKKALDKKDKDLDDDIKAEATTARAAEQELTSKLAEAVKQHSTDKKTLEDSISAEADRAGKAEAANLAKIKQEITDRTSADQELDTKIDQVNTAVTDEVSARETAIQDVTNAYTAADTALEKKVTDAYTAANTNLKNAIDAEITAEASTREEVATNLTNEIARVKGEENTLSTSIANEVAARTQAIKNVTDAYMKAVTNEADRAEKAESTLQTNINATNTALDSLKNDSVVLYDADSSKATVTLGGLTGTTITNLKDGAVSETSKDAVTGKQLNDTNNSISNLSAAIDTKLNAVKADLRTADATLQTNINNETTRATAAERALRMATDADIDAGAWSSKIATGTVASAETKAVSGDTVFTEVRVAKDGSIIKATNTAAANIMALDKEVADAKATLTDTISKNLEDTNEALNKKASVKFDNLDEAAHTAIKTDAVNSVKVSAGSHVDVALSTDSTLTDKTYVVKVLDGDVAADSAELVTGQKVYAAINEKATEVSGAADTKIQDNANAITSLKDLTNLTDAGKAAAKALAKEAIVVAAGDRATITGVVDDATGNKTYTVTVKNDGKVEENNTDLVSGDTVYKAMQTASKDTDAKLVTKADVAGGNIDADAWSKKFAIGDIADTELKAVSGSKVAAAIANAVDEEDRKVTAIDERLQTAEGKVATNKTTLDEHATKLSKHDEAIANLQTAASTDTVKATAKEAISIAEGDHVTVTKDSTDTGKYTIAVKAGEVAPDSEDFVSGEKINTAIEKAKSDLQTQIDKKANASDVAASIAASKLEENLKAAGIADGEAGFVNGDQAYEELRPVNGKYVLASNTTAKNLEAIDKQVDANTTAIATNTQAIATNKASIDTLSKKDIIVQSDQNAAGNNESIHVEETETAEGKKTYKLSVPKIAEIEDELDKKAKADGSSINSKNKNDWVSNLKAQNGVEENETSLVSGAQVFSYVKSETHPAELAPDASYNYIKTDVSAGTNFQNLDAAVKKNETAISTNKNSIDTLKTDTDISSLFTDRKELESLSSKKIADVLAYLFNQGATLAQFALDDYEDVHKAVSPTSTIKLAHKPIGKIRIYINGKREFNNPNEKTNQLFTYNADTKEVTFNSENMGYIIGDGATVADTVVFEYDYDRRSETTTTSDSSTTNN